MCKFFPTFTARVTFLFFLTVCLLYRKEYINNERHSIVNVLLSALLIYMLHSFKTSDEFMDPWMKVLPLPPVAQPSPTICPHHSPHPPPSPRPPPCTTSPPTSSRLCGLWEDLPDSSLAINQLFDEMRAWEFKRGSRQLYLSLLNGS